MQEDNELKAMAGGALAKLRAFFGRWRFRDWLMLVVVVLTVALAAEVVRAFGVIGGLARAVFLACSVGYQSWWWKHRKDGGSAEPGTNA